MILKLFKFRLEAEIEPTPFKRKKKKRVGSCRILFLKVQVLNMNIVIYVSWQIKIDDICNVRDVATSIGVAPLLNDFKARSLSFIFDNSYSLYIFGEDTTGTKEKLRN